MNFYTYCKIKQSKNHQPEFINGELNATQRQIAAMIDQQLGGWPAAALTLYKFNAASTDGTTTYQFADDKGVSLDGNRKFSYFSEWVQAMSRDDYYLLRLSAGALISLKQKFRDAAIADIQAKLQSLKG